MSTPLDSLNAKIFREQLHSQFTVRQDNSATITLELVDVVENDLSPKMELFSLQFRGPAAPRMAQHIHTLEHDKLGRFDIFLTAVAGDAQSITYESVFHRFRKTAP
ncbi:MAG TPA: hypothetical protein VGJ30_17625 [Candidatus Angelobacter sp.]